MQHTYALILAGGSGTRFWPLSRNHKPKQLLNVIGDNTLLQKAIARLEGLVPTEHILILTNPLQEQEVRAQATTLPYDNIIAEPCRRDTAPAIAYGIALVAARDPKATMLVIPSDQLIQDENSFRALLKEALETASSHDILVTLGIKPTWPCPSYGYIQTGEPFSTSFDSPSSDSQSDSPSSFTCKKVIRFREKPDTATAEQFLKQGNFSWNAGMFVWSLPSVRNQLAQHTPELAEFIDIMASSPSPVATADILFPKLTPISIDFALMEKATNVVSYEASFDWDDVGSWLSLGNYLDAIEHNRTNSSLTSLDAQDNIVFSTDKKKRVALLGVDHLIIVDTGDALLIADQSQADNIKHLVNKLPEELL